MSGMVTQAGSPRRDESVQIGALVPLTPPGWVEEEYARALFQLHEPRATPGEIENLVSARLGRQAALRADPAPDFFAILDEAVLLRSFGGPAVMRAQLEFLLEMTLTPTTVIQVLPHSQGDMPWRADPRS
ncbi:DUF5753 domain-containing protein [Streptomyces sp. NBC_01511]|uniref:DUF5753 domain-containing protein n=1 Tax=unclassified Streptomyces TaxID=2593676 RepID=UPI00386F1E27